MSRPRLCVVLPHVLLGGGETSMMEVAEGLSERFELEVCAFDLRPLESEVTIRDELLERFGRVTFLRERWQLRAKLDTADIVLWYGILKQVPRALSKLAYRPTSVRVIHTERSLDGPRFQRRWGGAIDGVISVSPSVARRIPGAVFIPNSCSRRNLRGPARTFFPTTDRKRKTLGFLGRLVPSKNVRWLVRHLGALDCNLLLQAVDTELLTTQELRDLAATLGVGPRVRFLAPGRDVGTLLRSVDALVIASEHEGFPMVAVEAGVLGVPVISTRVGALPELFGSEIQFVERDGNGRFPSVRSLRSAIETIEPARGELLRRRVAELCSLESVVALYGDYLQAVHDRVRAGRRISA